MASVDNGHLTCKVNSGTRGPGDNRPDKSTDNSLQPSVGGGQCCLQEIRGTPSAFLANTTYHMGLFSPSAIIMVSTVESFNWMYLW